MVDTRTVGLAGIRRRLIYIVYSNTHSYHRSNKGHA